MNKGGGGGAGAGGIGKRVDRCGKYFMWKDKR